MKIRTRIAAALCAAFIVAGGLVATAMPANADPDSECSSIPLPFPIDGEYSVGGPARPRIICTGYNLFLVDMSAFGRPTAYGVINDRFTINVTFPDDTTYGANLYGGDTKTIRWINGTVWTKARTPVPSLRNLRVDAARSVLNAAGFILGNQVAVENCPFDGRIFSQSPSGGTLANPGTVVHVRVGTC